MNDGALRDRLLAANMKLVADTGFLGTDDALLEVAVKGPTTEQQRNYNVGMYLVHRTTAITMLSICSLILFFSARVSEVRVRERHIGSRTVCIRNSKHTLCNFFFTNIHHSTFPIMSKPGTHQDWCVPPRIALCCSYLYNFYGKNSTSGFIAESRFDNIRSALAEDLL